jgi:hypothetical protein
MRSGWFLARSVPVMSQVVEALIGISSGVSDDKDVAHVACGAWHTLGQWFLLFYLTDAKCCGINGALFWWCSVIWCGRRVFYGVSVVLLSSCLAFGSTLVLSFGVVCSWGKHGQLVRT